MRLIDADFMIGEVPTFYGGIWNEARVKDFIRCAPTIDAEPVRHGRWLADNNNPYESAYVCSCCKLSEVVPTRMYKPLWEYCPNCGARMEDAI